MSEVAVVPQVASGSAVALSPEWWVARLYDRLVTRRREIDFYDAYYRGDHPLPWLAPQAREEFRRVLSMTRSNYAGLVIDAQVELINVEGFRFGRDSTADADTWRIWQANNLDADSDQAFLEAAIGGQSYLLVAPNPADAGTPSIWVEHASQAIVEFQPGTGRRVRAAGLKVWDDDWTGEVHATLFLPDRIYKYKAKASYVAAAPRWEQRFVAGEEENGVRRNPLNAVPLVELPNNPRLLTGGISELADLTDIQDRINKTIADRLITQDYGAFPQKWAKAWPDEDDDGNPTPPIDIGRNRMVTTAVKETEFGQWESAPLDPYSSAKREDVKDMASRSRTPADYLLGEMNNVNGETLKASRAGLVSKVKQRRRPLGEGLEAGMRLARQLAGLSNEQDMFMETIFSNPEYRTEGELTDATVKKLQTTPPVISVRQAREDLGYTATQIVRLEAEDREMGLEAQLARITRPMRTGAGDPDAA